MDRGMVFIATRHPETFVRVCYTYIMMDSEIGGKLLHFVRKTLEDHSPPVKGRIVVACVSGGPDSMAMMHLLHEVSIELSFSILVAHLDHRLRPDSDEEARFVAESARELGLDVRETSVDVRSLAEKSGISVEEAGRRARYSFFDEVSRDADAAAIATAHHRDDAIETFFLRILRGSSLTGLGGIPRTRGKLVRPLIRAARSEIMDFLEAEQIPFLIDPTNLSADTDRNFIRNRLFPLIAERFPGFRGSVARTLDLVRSEEDYLHARSSSLFAEVAEERGGRIVLDARAMAALPRPLGARVVREALYRVSGPHVRWTRRHLDAVMEAISRPNPSSSLDLPGGIRFRREYGKAFLEIGIPAQAQHFLVSVTGPGEVETPGGSRILFRVLEGKPPPAVEYDGRSAALFDAAGAGFPLVLRSPRPGDRFRPWGMGGSRKLSDLFIDRKIPRAQRGSIPILEGDGRILWVAGLARSREAPVSDESSSLLEVRLL